MRSEYGGSYLVAKVCWDLAVDREALLDVIVSMAQSHARADGYTVLSGWAAGPDETDLLMRRPLINAYVYGPVDVSMSLSKGHDDE